jgi:hypothetical protein
MDRIALTILAFSLVGCAEAGAPPRTATPTFVGSDAGTASPTPDAGPVSSVRPDAPVIPLIPDAPVVEETVLPGVPPLRCGRTYDHETSMLVRGGAPAFATMRHRDGTSLPASEGGASCGSGCDEEVTRLCDGDSLTGVLMNAETFSVQGAQSGEDGTGSLVVTVCGEELAPMSYSVDTSTLPGFVNGPQPAASVPTLDRCEVSVRAVGGCVWVRAVTVTCSANQP